MRLSVGFGVGPLRVSQSLTPRGGRSSGALAKVMAVALAITVALYVITGLIVIFLVVKLVVLVVQWVVRRHRRKKAVAEAAHNALRGLPTDDWRSFYQGPPTLTGAREQPSVAVETSDPAGDHEPVADDGAWTPQDLRRFIDSGTATSITISAVMDVLCARPDWYLSTADLVTATGIGRAKLKGAFSALTRHAAAQYPGRVPMFSSVSGTNLLPPRDAQAHYLVSADSAELWRDARRSHAELTSTIEGRTRTPDRSS